MTLLFARDSRVQRQDVPKVLFGGAGFKLHQAFVYVLDFDQAGQEDEDGAAGVGNVFVHGVVAVLDNFAILVESRNQTSHCVVVKFVYFGFQFFLCGNVGRKILCGEK